MCCESHLLALSEVRVRQSNGTDGSMTPKAHILISGRDYQLLRTRGRVLETAGYRVSTTVEPIQPSEAAQIQLLIVCHTLSAIERQRDVSVLAELSSTAKALCLMPHAGPAIMGTTVLDSFCGPREMLQVVERLLTI